MKGRSQRKDAAHAEDQAAAVHGRRRHVRDAQEREQILVRTVQVIALPQHQAGLPRQEVAQDEGVEEAGEAGVPAEDLGLCV